jgi:hypothetical protein
VHHAYSYTVYGLVLRVPFPCSTLQPVPDESAPDVTVAEGPVPAELAARVAAGLSWQAAPGRFLSFAGRRTGRFLVEDGCRVTIDRSPAATDARIRLHFLSAVMAAVLRQRGMLVLHANAVLTATGALVFSGASGTGKSTTLGALLQQGYRMLADDMTAVHMGGDGVVTVVPGIPQFNLPSDAAASLRQATDGMARRRGRRIKVSIPAAIAADRAPLRALYLLQPEAGTSVRREAVTGAAKFTALHGCLYGPAFQAEREALFPLEVALLAQTPVYRLVRPLDRWSMDDVLEVMLQD